MVAQQETLAFANGLVRFPLTRPLRAFGFGRIPFAFSQKVQVWSAVKLGPYRAVEFGDVSGRA